MARTPVLESGWSDGRFATSASLSKATQCGYVSDAKMWLFAVDDGGSDVVLSWEVPGTPAQIFLAHLDPRSGSSDFASDTWTARDVIAAVADAVGDIADHWHIFAHGYHWISYSNTTQDRLRLAVFDRDFSQVGSEIEVANIPGYVYPAGLAPAPLVDITDAAPTFYSTNDHFMVKAPQGVAIGIRYASGTDAGTLMIVVSADGTLVRSHVLLETTGPTAFTNLASATAISATSAYWGGVYAGPTRDILAPDTISAGGTLGPNILYVFSTNLKMDTITHIEWSKTVTTVQQHQLAMATEVLLENGWRVVTCRDIADPTAITMGDPDDGDIVRWLLDDSWVIQGRDPETISTVVGDCNRPHTCIFGNLLLTTWDESTAGGCYLRVDDIGY